VRRTGSDLTIITVGATLYRALEAADGAGGEVRLSTEVIDARFINPLNYGAAGGVGQEDGQGAAGLRRVRARLLPAHHGHEPDAAGLRLSGRPAVVSARATGSRRRPSWRTCSSRRKEWIVDAIHERILPLPGHKPSTRQGTGEILRRNRLGGKEYANADDRISH
jgi:2-oxoisovalerate dehydrogenase E1 component